VHACINVCTHFTNSDMKILFLNREKRALRGTHPWREVCVFVIETNTIEMHSQAHIDMAYVHF
jgi:hypothetical protein